MAKTYRVITNIASGSAESRREATEQAAALGQMIGCGPVAENAILPDRHPSNELAASLVPDDIEVDEMDNELRDAVADFKSLFGNSN